MAILFYLFSLLLSSWEPQFLTWITQALCVAIAKTLATNDVFYKLGEAQT